MINRRTLVKSGVTLGLAAGTAMTRTAAASESSPKEQPRRRPWKLAFLASLGYQKMKPAQVVQSLSKLGYDGIEWTTGHLDSAKPLPGLRELVARTHDAGMEVSRISTVEDLVSLDDDQRRRRIERTVRVIEAAGQCGVKNVGATLGPFPWRADAPRIGENISESTAWAQIFEAYEAFGKAAAAAGVVISSEAVFGMVAHDFYTHKFMMDQLDGRIQKINFDPSHGILYGNYDVGWVIRQWGDRIAHVHLKDAVGEPVRGKFLFPLLGEGRVDWGAAFEALEAIGYQGFCSVEFESFGYYQRVLEGDAEAAARLSMQQVQALGGR